MRARRRLLRCEFPALASLGSFPHNLPIQTSSFVGREHDLAAARKNLRDTRLLTLTGPGGTGKTRLALQLAAEVVPDYRDGVWLVELAPQADPGAVVPTICSALAIHERLGMDLERSLRAHLMSRRVLLVLDNCEHLVAEAARVALALLERCPDVDILATSRELLDVPGEHHLAVPPLQLEVAERRDQAAADALQL